IMEYFVKISLKARILKVKQRNLKNNVLTFYTPYPSRKIRRICACTSQETTKNKDLYVKMDDPNITMEEYIRLEEEKAHRRGKVYNWETATYGKIWCDEDVHDLRSVETEFPAIIFNDALTFEITLLCEPTISPLNDNQIDFRISFDESDDEDYTVIYDKSSFSYKIISVNDLKTDSENDNDKVNMPSFSSSDPTVSYFDDFDYFKDFEKEFSAIAYNDALTSKLDFSEPTIVSLVGPASDPRDQPVHSQLIGKDLVSGLLAYELPLRSLRKKCRLNLKNDMPPRDNEETLELVEESRLKMLAKQNDPSLKEKRVNIAPVDYVALNKLSNYFVKHFVPQKQLSAEQVYWLPISKPISKKPPVPSVPVLKKEIPRELPSIRAFEKDVKPFAQTLKEYFCMFEHGLNKELKEMKAVFTQMETEVAKCSVDKKYFEIEKKELSLDNDRFLEHIICQEVLNIVMHANDHSDNVLHANNNSLEHDNSALELLKHENDRLMELLISQDLVHTPVNFLAAINDYKSMQQSFVDEYNETLVLKAELAKKNDMIEKAVYNELLKRLYKLDLPPLSPCIKNNMAAHVDYLKHTQENADILCEIVKHARDLRHLDSDLASAFCNKNVKHSMLNANSELVCATCHECMIDAIHDLCVSGYLNDVNARVKPKSVKSRYAKSKMKKMWKPIGKVYTTIRYSWKPTGRTFTIVGNTCPLTRIISTNVVPPRKSISATPVKQTQPSSNKSGKPKDIKHVGSSSQSKTIGRTNHTLIPGLGLLQAYDWVVLSAQQLR
ncbi:hypothetical protein Tco_0593019, partial [Tanacetum coccineum]